MHFDKVRDEVKPSSGDLVDINRFEPAMHHLPDMYIRADDSETLVDFNDIGLVELIVYKGADTLDNMPDGSRKDCEAMAEAVDNNVRNTIVDENPVNPEYHEQMYVLLDELITLRRKKVTDYQKYLERIREFARKVVHSTSTSADYPAFLDTSVKRVTFDNYGSDEVPSTKTDSAIRYTKNAYWVGDRF